MGNAKDRLCQKNPATSNLNSRPPGQIPDANPKAGDTGEKDWKRNQHINQNQLIKRVRMSLQKRKTRTDEQTENAFDQHERPATDRPKLAAHLATIGHEADIERPQPLAVDLKPRGVHRGTKPSG